MEIELDDDNFSNIIWLSTLLTTNKETTKQIKINDYDIIMNLYKIFDIEYFSSLEFIIFDDLFCNFSKNCEILLKNVENYKTQKNEIKDYMPDCSFQIKDKKKLILDYNTSLNSLLKNIQIVIDNYSLFIIKKNIIFNKIKESILEYAKENKIKISNISDFIENFVKDEILEIHQEFFEEYSNLSIENLETLNKDSFGDVLDDIYNTVNMYDEE